MMRCRCVGRQMVVAVILATKFGHGEELSTGYGLAVVIATCVFTVAYGWSWGPFGWLVPTELFPLETRSAGQAMVVCVNLLFTFSIAQCFLAMLCHLKWGVFVLFACLILIMTFFVLFLLPETKQEPIEEIHYLFEKHWYWKRIVCRGGGDGKVQSQPQENKTTVMDA